MSSTPRRRDPSFHVTTWPAPTTPTDLPFDLPPGVAVVGIGESAHFVEELNRARADVVRRLRTHHPAAVLALEVGDDEAPGIEAWLHDPAPTPLREVVGPLTHCLYGTFLTTLRDTLAPGEHVAVLGVDLPNSLTPEASLAPLAALVERLDPDTLALVERARGLASGVRGGSAAASAFAWSEVDERTQDALTVCLTRLRGRVDALSAVADARDEADWVAARRLADAAVTTELMLRAMADLFAGGGLPADTTLRERYIAQRLLEAVDGLEAGQVVVYVAHDNHVQKTPVVFDGVVAAYPVGQLLARRLGSRYWCLALSHLDAEVPEMVVPATNDVGFRVERAAAAALVEHSVEAAATQAPGDALLVRPEPPQSEEAQVMSVRSQSACVEVPTTAFDATLVVRTATTDPLVAHLVDPPEPRSGEGRPGAGQ